MHVLHEYQKVKPWIAQSLHEACLDTLTRFQANGIPLDAVMCKLALLWREPLGGERLIRQKPDADDRDADGDNTFDDEKPDLVSTHTGHWNIHLLTIAIRACHACRQGWRKWLRRSVLRKTPRKYFLPILSR